MTVRRMASATCVTGCAGMSQDCGQGEHQDCCQPPVNNTGAWTLMLLAAGPGHILDRWFRCRPAIRSSWSRR
jgi:hypothetical protein